MAPIMAMVRTAKGKRPKPPKLKVRKYMSTATVTVTFPTQDVNGTPIPASDILTATIQDVTSGTPVILGTVVQPATSFTTGPLVAGAYVYEAFVTGSEGMSAESQTVSFAISPTLSPPAAPSLSVVVNP